MLKLVRLKLRVARITHLGQLGDMGVADGGTFESIWIRMDRLAVGEQGCHAILYALTLLIFCDTYLNVSKQK